MAEVALPISRKSLGSVRSKAIASISSKRIIIRSGCGKLLISVKSVARFFCVWPNLLSTTVEKSTIYISRSRMRASCLTASVFPVPGAPWKRNLWIPIRCAIAFTTPRRSCMIESGSNKISSFASILSKNVDSCPSICGTKVFTFESNDIIYSANWWSPDSSKSLAISYDSFLKPSSFFSV